MSPNSLANLRPFKTGNNMNPLGRASERTIEGIPVSKFMSDNLGPAAMKVAEKVLLHAATKNPEDITKLEVDMAQFMINRVYGKAEEKIVLDATVTQTDDYDLSKLDVNALEQIMNIVTVEANAVITDESNDD